MVASVNTNFIVQNGLTVGSATIFAGNGDIITGGNLTVQGTQTTVQNETTTGNFVPSANVTYNIGSTTAWWNNIYGTLQTAAQPNITTLAGVTSIGASASTTLTGTLQTAAQTNVTSLGTLTGLTTGTILPSANVTQNLGSTTAWWNNIYGTATHALYADLAENYQADKFYNPGTVLQFGGTAEVTVADADTTRVAGVVSTNPAHLMNGALSGPNVTALALTGRVPCMVVGPVAKGDLMVSAGWGYAKSNNGAGVGQVIGKALQDFPVNSKGVIEVVVGRV